ncbi:MAG: helix-turn-helix domain-containing protein [Bacteroidales bacterium]|nr:helix-turn-helix domain-containing protein [Bacteroidales bacterium]
MPEINFNNLQESVSQLLSKLDKIEKLLLNNSNQSETENLLTVSQAIKFLNLSVSTIYGYVPRKEIPVCKRKETKRLYFSKKQLTEWILEGKKQTISEIKNEAHLYLKKKRGNHAK